MIMNEDIILDPGEEICDKCHGEGTRIIEIKVGFNSEIRKVYCSKCRGTKKIDWIEKVVGVKEKEIFYPKINISPKFSDLLTEWKKIQLGFNYET